MSKKSFPSLYSNWLYKNGQDFLDIQYMCLCSWNRWPKPKEWLLRAYLINKENMKHTENLIIFINIWFFILDKTEFLFELLKRRTFQLVLCFYLYIYLLYIYIRYRYQTSWYIIFTCCWRRRGSCRGGRWCRCTWWRWWSRYTGTSWSTPCKKNMLSAIYFIPLILILYWFWEYFEVGIKPGFFVFQNFEIDRDPMALIFRW